MSEVKERHSNGKGNGKFAFLMTEENKKLASQEKLCKTCQENTSNFPLWISFSSFHFNGLLLFGSLEREESRGEKSSGE